MSLQRREFLAVLGICAAASEELLAQHAHHGEGAVPAFADYRPRAFTQSEYELIDQLAETLLPADETGPGAHDAHVAYYIDVVLYHSSAQKLQLWKNGLAGMGALAQQQQELLSQLAKNEMAPSTELEHFFVDFKRTVIEGFYASELIQREHLGYRGNTAVMEFQGCSHLNFEHPDLT